MTPAIAIGALIAIATLVASWRTWRDGRTWRVPRLLLQPVVAVLLVLALVPPYLAHEAPPLVVVTAAADPAVLAALPTDAVVAAMPEAGGETTFKRFPDLGSALRAHPGTTTLRVLGDGLAARDADAARGLAVTLEPGLLPRGLVELDAPARVEAGAAWRLSGRIAGLEGARIELRDRGDDVVGSAIVDAEGRFVVRARAKGEGRDVLALLVKDEADATLERVPVPLVVGSGEAVRVGVVAGAPDAELRMLARWARDAGLAWSSRLALSRGIAMRDGDVRLDAEGLRALDLLVLDERSWAGLGAPAKAAVGEAVDEGLGLLLRATGPLPAPVAREWATLGIDLEAAAIEPAVTLDASVGGEPVVATRRPLGLRGETAVPLVLAADATPLAAWTARGHGRVGAIWLLDSHRLALRGDAQGFGAAWSRIVATLARARGEASLAPLAPARVGERRVLCGLGEASRVTPADDPDTAATALVADADAQGCAAWWPREAGWQFVRDATSERFVYVRAADEAPGLASTEAVERTQRLAAHVDTASIVASRHPAPRGPFFLAWLAAAALLWTLERHARPRT